MSSSVPVTARMQARIQEWKAASDDKALFLNCYMMMTRNMLASLQRKEFKDSVWVDRLLHHFADYYFSALEAYEYRPASAPAVWRHAHQVTRDPEISALQKILLGINAHINYDLVLTLVDLLRPEWADLSADQRAVRYADHCYVNKVIGQTIDAVQDEVLEPAMPFMDLIDKALGPFDEMLISHLVTRWREAVWLNAADLLVADTLQERGRLIGNVEEETLRIATYICHKPATAS